MNYWQRLNRKTLSRRRLMRGAALGVAGGVGGALVGCGDDDDGGESPGGSTVEGGTSTAESSGSPVGEAQLDGVKRGGVFTFTLPDDPPTLDPFAHLSYLSQYIGSHSYSRLLKFNTGPGVEPLAEMIPDVAESLPEIVDEGRTLVFKVRPGVRFHDKEPVSGRELTAADVVSSIERFRSDSVNRGILDVIETVDSPDDQTVTLTLSQPSASIIENLTSFNGPWIMSEEANTGTIDPTQVDGVIGTGPWIMREHRSAVELLFDANPEWYETVETSNGSERLPLIDGVQILIMSEYAQQMSQFVAGRIHTFTPRNIDIAEVRSQYPDVQEMPIRPGWNGVYHWMNKESNNGLFNDVRARRALSLAIDREGLIQALGEISTVRDELGVDIEWGWNTLLPWGDGGMYWYIDPNSPEFGEASQWHQFDPAQSRQLLEEVGYDGETIEFNFTPAYGGTYDQFVEAQFPMLRDAGFNINVNTWEYRRMIGSEEQKTIPGIFYNWQTPFATVGEYLKAAFTSSDYATMSDLRRYPTDEIVDLVEKQELELDRESRREIIHDVVRLSSQEMTQVPAPMTRWGQVTMRHPDLRNAVFRTAGYGFPVETLPYYWFDR